MFLKVRLSILVCFCASFLTVAQIGAQCPPTYVAYVDTGNVVSDAFGAAVSFVGDVNGDGFDDYIVGAPGQAQVIGEALFIGVAQLYSGFNGSLVSSLAGGVGDRFGAAVGPAGDINADGFANILIGSPTEDSSGTAPLGRVYAVSGVDGSFLLTADGFTSFGRIGSSAKGINDLNGN